jgi:hypothetical protein
MKDQYVGDVNDFWKYTLLRAMAVGSRRLVVCWMLTPDDRRGDGRKVSYLREPDALRDVDPVVFDALRRAIVDGRRSVRVVEQSGLLDGAQFVSGVLDDDLAGRSRYFQRCLGLLRPGDLVFFDPDNGFEIASVKRGARNSSKFVFWSEVASAIAIAGAACVYQHFPRVDRGSYVAALLARARVEVPQCEAFAVHTSQIAFVVLCRQGDASALLSAASTVADATPALTLIAG